MKNMPALPEEKALQLLDLHYDTFFSAAAHARQTGHPVPMDTRGWSQVLVSTLVGINGPERKKARILLMVLMLRARTRGSD
jgi:hypothetical protein